MHWAHVSETCCVKEKEWSEPINAKRIEAEVPKFMGKRQIYLKKTLYKFKIVLQAI